MSRIAIFFHGVFIIEGKLLDAAVPIIHGQMRELKECGLYEACDELHVGINGTAAESGPFVAATILPAVELKYHGAESRNENSTLLMIEKWVKAHKGEDWNVLYFHSKGVTHPSGHADTTRWRKCMAKHLVTNWRQCVADLEFGFDVAGNHYMTGKQTPPGQTIFAGNFWWSKLSHLETLPSIMERDRIKISGIGALDSRYESEIWLFNGDKPPKVRNYHNGWIDSCIV